MTAGSPASGSDFPLFNGRVGLQQRVLPAYRAPFCETLAEACRGGLSVFAGEPLPAEHISPARGLSRASWEHTHNRHFLQPDSPLYCCWQDGIVSWLEKWQPDVLIVEANPRYLSTPAAVRWMHARRRPVVGWGLGAPPLRGFLARLRSFSRQRLFHSLDGVIAYSQRGAQEYCAVGFKPHQVFVAPNAVALRPVASPPARPAEFPDRPRLLFVGRLQARKRIDLLLMACAALPPSLQPELFIVGDGPARAELERLAASNYPLAHFTGARYGDELESYFKIADVFVLPGTGGLAVQQAMSFGLPVIVAQGDGTQDDLVRPQNGWRIPADDLLALTEALTAALSDPLRLRKMGSESYRIVAEEANLQAMAAVFVRALNSVVMAMP